MPEEPDEAFEIHVRRVADFLIVARLRGGTDLSADHHPSSPRPAIRALDTSFAPGARVIWPVPPHPAKNKHECWPETEPHSGAFMRSTQAITTRDGARRSELCPSISALARNTAVRRGAR